MTSSPAQDVPSGRSWSDGAVAIALFGVALVIFAAPIPLPTLGDGVRLARMLEDGPAPYYNLGYLPAAWAFHAALAPLVDWTPIESMPWFAAVCGAAAVAALFAVVHSVGLDRRVGAALALVVALTPGTWFFSCVTEIHALQLLGIACGTWLALRARNLAGWRGTACVSAAVLACMLSHSSGLLMAPAVAALAAGGEWRKCWTKSVAGLVAGLAMGLACAWGAREWARVRAGTATEATDYFVMLRIGRGSLERSAVADLWFGPSEIAEYLGHELVQPAAALLAALPFVALHRNAWLRIPLALALAPGLLLYPQGHIREDGAYYLSLYPFLALLAAGRLQDIRATRARVAAVLIGLALVQGWLGWRKIEAQAATTDVAVWGAELEASIARAAGPATPAQFFVGAQPRFDWLDLHRPDDEVSDALRALELVPSRRRPAIIEGLLGLAATKLAAGGSVYFDADLLDAPARPSFLADLESRLRSFPVRLEPLAPAEGAATVLYRLRVDEERAQSGAQGQGG